MGDITAICFLRRRDFCGCFLFKTKKKTRFISEPLYEKMKNTLEKEYNMELEEHHNYVFYIGQVACEPEEETKIFFELCHNFFDEVKRNIK